MVQQVCRIKNSEKIHGMERWIPYKYRHTYAIKKNRRWEIKRGKDLMLGGGG